MEDILFRIANDTRERVMETKNRIPIEQIKEKALSIKGEREDFLFEKALGKDGVSLICEVKKASPSKGLISPDFPYRQIAREYEEGGASAISVLTEPHFFMGSSEYLKKIRTEVDIPLLRKDFTVDEYQIYEAKTLGADAVLLICSILDDRRLERFLALAKELGMNALVEAHDEMEIGRAVEAGAKIIGVNNRNLKDFSVDTSNSMNLRKLVPKDRIFVAESGIRSPEDIIRMKETGVDAALIGETFMRASDRRKEVGKYAAAGNRSGVPGQQKEIYLNES